VTRRSILEYVQAVRERYLQGTKEGKGKILDELTRVTGRHRKAAIRLIRRGNKPVASNKRGRPRQYGAHVAGALRLVWEATDRLCSKRLHTTLSP
jgi:DNA primase catalytic subunit